MNHHTPDDRPDPRTTFPASPPFDPPRVNANDDFRLSIYQGENDEWYHRLVSKHNGQNVLREGYKNKAHLVRMLSRVMPELEIHEDKGPHQPAGEA